MEKAHLQLRNYTNFIDDIQYREESINLYVTNMNRVKYKRCIMERIVVFTLTIEQIKT